HADRYTRGEEFMEVVKALWDSWATDAVVDNRASGIYARRERIRPINHRGDFYTVAGPLNMPRCPQGRPVLVQAGSSDTGRRLSGRFGGHDFSHLPLDRPLTPQDFPDPDTVEAARSRTEVILNLVRRDKPTLRQLLGYLAGARGHFVTAGTPEQIADLIEDWF